MAYASEPVSNDWYSSGPVANDTLDDRVMATAVTGWTDTDHTWLGDIRLALTSNRTGTLLYYTSEILGKLRDVYNKLFDIGRDTAYLQNINTNSNNILSYLKDDLRAPVIREFLADIERNTQSFVSAWTKEQAASVTGSTSVLSNLLGPLENIELYKDGNWEIIGNVTFERFLSSLYVNSSLYANNDWGQPTLYSLVHDLKTVLASDDDKALADAQKSNREQIEQDFVSGQSGGTSLGPSDFGDLSNVGGSIKDMASLNGQASVGGFVSGLGDADKEAEGWFSAATRDTLDEVTNYDEPAPSSDRLLDPDPYNMAGFDSHYAWVFGGGS